MTTIFGDNITEEEIEKFKPLLDRSIEDVKTELQTIAKNYYESIVVNDAELFNSSVAQLKKYLEFDIIDINEYLNYCLVMASNEILKKICDVDSIYIPRNVDLKFSTKYVRQNENYIKQSGLNDHEVKLLTQYIKEKHDITCLTYAIDDIDVNSLKPKTNIPQDLLKNVIVNTNYIRGNEVKKSGEFFFAIDKSLENFNEIRERRKNGNIKSNG